MRRLFWRLSLPFVIVANKLGASYKWVNVARSAWAHASHNDLWHYRWFGDRIDMMPDFVNLCGTMYRVTVAEGLVSFRCDDGMSATRIEFRRDPHDQYGFLWYSEVNGNFPACHYERAYEWIKAVYGGSHEIKQKPL